MQFCSDCTVCPHLGREGEKCRSLSYQWILNVKDTFSLGSEREEIIVERINHIMNFHKGKTMLSSELIKIPDWIKRDVKRRLLCHASKQTRTLPVTSVLSFQKQRVNMAGIIWKPSIIFPRWMHWQHPPAGTLFKALCLLSWMWSSVFPQ